LTSLKPVSFSRRTLLRGVSKRTIHEIKILKNPGTKIKAIALIRTK